MNEDEVRNLFKISEITGISDEDLKKLRQNISTLGQVIKESVLVISKVVQQFKAPLLTAWHNAIATQHNTGKQKYLRKQRNRKKLREKRRMKGLK